MKRRRFSLEVRPGAVVLLSGLYFLLPLRWCARLALTVTVHELGHVAALILCGAQVCGLRMEGCGLVLRCTPPLKILIICMSVPEVRILFIYMAN